MTTQLSTSDYLYLLPCARTRTTTNTQGEKVKEKLNINALSICWDHIRVFFHRLEFFLFKTHKWPNVVWLSEKLREELKQIKKGLKKTEVGKLPSSYSPQKIAAIQKIYERIDNCGTTNSSIRRKLKEIEQSIKDIRKKVKRSLNSPPSSSVSLPPPPEQETKKRAPFPLHDDQTLEGLFSEPELLLEYAHSIRKKHAKEPHDQLFFEEVERRFNDSWLRALPKATPLYETFRAQYNPFAKICVVKDEEGNPLIKASLYQFQKALQLAKEHFPHLILLASNSTQRAKVTRLIQIILMGRNSFPDDGTFPSSEFCFTLSELYGEEEGQFIPKKSAPYFIEMGENGFLDYQLTNLQKTLQGVDKNISFASAIESAIELFAKNFIEKPEDFSIKIQNQRLELDQKMFSIIRDLYYQHLYNNPEETSKVIDHFKHAPIVKKILDAYPGTAQDLTISHLPGNFLEHLLASLIEKYTTSPKEKTFVCEQLARFKENTYFSEEQIKKIAEATKQSESVIEPLMRIKLLEFMMILNQSIVFYPQENLNKSHQKDVDKNFGIYVSEAAGLKLLLEGNLTKFDAEIKFPLKASYTTRPENLFANDAPCAEIYSTLTYQAGQLTVIDYSFVKFGWLAPESVWVRLATQIEPYIYQMQPPFREKDQAQQLEGFLENLSELSKIQEDYDIQIDDKGRLTTVSLKGWFGLGLSKPNPQNLNALEFFFKLLFPRFKKYKKICKRIGDEKKAIELFQEVLPKGMEGLLILQKTYEGQEGNLQIKKLYEKVQAKYQKLITPLPLRWMR
ncbi:hypothetical protein [Parachlamydia sp. AcF125]|uniref:hypothetical protein n=1 Tax=Parachlamydia sp. AcF125 TaxID=2795736 RepID=UPI001BC9081B|nr:hypothetical protein [Parachlamydia sp. AcF125]MBS4167961.1 hypothetical protein [Parachlamydia sp. AcF125]